MFTTITGALPLGVTLRDGADRKHQVRQRAERNESARGEKILQPHRSLRLAHSNDSRLAGSLQGQLEVEAFESLEMSNYLEQIARLGVSVGPEHAHEALRR